MSAHLKLTKAEQLALAASTLNVDALLFLEHELREAKAAVSRLRIGKQRAMRSSRTATGATARRDKRSRFGGPTISLGGWR